MKSLVVINPNKFWIAFLNVPQNKWSTKLGQASTEQELRLKGTGRGLSVTTEWQGGRGCRQRPFTHHLALVLVPQVGL